MRYFTICLLVLACLVNGCGDSKPKSQEPEVMKISAEELRPINRPAQFNNKNLRVSGTLVFESNIYFKDNGRWISINVFRLYDKPDSERYVKIYSRSCDTDNPDTVPWVMLGIKYAEVVIRGKVEWLTQIGSFEVPGQWVFFIQKYEKFSQK
jgi:hypothetical protein